MAAPAAHASIHDLIAHLAGLGARRVAADSSAVQDAAGEFGISRDQGQQYRSAHARAECGLVVGGAEHGGGSGQHGPKTHLRVLSLKNRCSPYIS